MGASRTSPQYDALAPAACVALPMPVAWRSGIGNPELAEALDRAWAFALRAEAAPMNALAALLQKFAGPTGHGWQVYDTTAGVHWRDAAPRPDLDSVPDGGDPSASRLILHGTLVLSGFGRTWLPDGEGDLREGDEGESGISLIGRADEGVDSIAVVKWYPSDDIAGILRRQLATLRSSVDALDAPAPGHTRYLVRIDGAAPLHAEVFVDEEGGPGAPGCTTFLFRRHAPDEDPGGPPIEPRCPES
ncbi:MAG: hypothetical protein ACOY82_20030 [Pseudomonadota bacterium]